MELETKYQMLGSTLAPMLDVFQKHIKTYLFFSLLLPPVHSAFGTPYMVMYKFVTLYHLKQNVKSKKVKCSHARYRVLGPELIPVYSLSACRWLKSSPGSTHYRSLGPELIPVYRQSACRWLFKSSPGSRLPLFSTRPAVTFPAEERHCPLTSTKLNCLVTEAHRCEQLAQGCYAALPRWELNPWPNDRKSNALPLYHCGT